MIKKSAWMSAVVFVILLAVTWNLLNRDREPPDTSFLSLKRRTPDTLLVAYGTDTTVMVPGGKGWVVVKPVRYPADSYAVEALLKRLSPLEVEKVYDLPRTKLDAYGLRHPQAMIRASYVDLPPDSLLIGGSTPNAQFNYVRPGGRARAGLLASRTVRGQLLKTTRDLRDTQILGVPEFGVSRILVLDHGRERMELRKDPQGIWTLVQPFPGLADPGKTREYLSSLVHMTVQEFVREDGAGSAAYGLDAPVAGVRLETTAGETAGYSIGDSIPGEELHYADRPGHSNVFAVSKRYLTALQWPDFALRQSAPTTFGLAQVTSVTVETGSGRVSYQLAPRDTTVLDQTVDVLGSWVLLRAEAADPALSENLERFGLDRPEGRILWFADTDTLAVIDVGTQTGGQVPVRVSAGRAARPGEILLVPEAKIRPLWVYLQRRVENQPRS